MSACKSMMICSYIHSSKKRAEATALVDSGATKNFMNLNYARWLGLPLKRLDCPRQVYNVDSTLNRGGSLEFFMDVQVQMGTNRVNMRFFLMNLGDHKLILGYLWFAAIQPKINWLQGWLDHSQLPIIIWSPDAARAKFLPRTSTLNRQEQDLIFIA
jgi:Retroviral aspartyl protease